MWEQLYISKVLGQQGNSSLTEKIALEKIICKIPVIVQLLRHKIMYAGRKVVIMK